MENARDKSVKCPFYNGTVPRELKIRCEGVSEGCVTHLAFSSRAAYDAHMRGCCCRRYGDCGLFWALKEKYEEEYGEEA